jgi:hypothetical protein
MCRVRANNRSEHWSGFVDGRMRPDGPGRAVVRTAGSELPFRLYQEALIVIDGSIRGAGKLRFLVDTGAMRTVIDKRVKEKLGLAAAEGAVQLVAVNESRRVDQVIVPELKFGPVEITALRAVAGDLVYLSGAGTRIDAIIGLDVLRSSSFSINYEARRMTFGPPAASSQAVPFQTISPLLTVLVQVEDQPMRLMVDTAARKLVLFDGRAHAKLPNLPWRFTAVQSPAARSYVRELEIGRMRLGDAEWRRRPRTPHGRARLRRWRSGPLQHRDRARDGRRAPARRSRIGRVLWPPEVLEEISTETCLAGLEGETAGSLPAGSPTALNVAHTSRTPISPRSRANALSKRRSTVLGR